MFHTQQCRGLLPYWKNCREGHGLLPRPAHGRGADDSWLCAHQALPVPSTSWLCLILEFISFFIVVSEMGTCGAGVGRA